MFCSSCGTSVPDGSKFCVACGSSLQQSEETNEQLQESIQQAEEEYQPQPAQQQPIPQPQPTPQPEYRQQYKPMPQPASANINNVQPRADIREKVYGVGGWLLTLILLCIPIVNIILAFVWAFSGSVNKNKKNFAIAWIIILIIGLAITIVLYASVAAMLGSLFDTMGGGFGGEFIIPE